jgi:hypothetical protein
LFSSIVSFLFSLARDCPKQRNGEREQEKRAVAMFLNRYKHLIKLSFGFVILACIEVFGGGSRADGDSDIKKRKLI